MSMQAKLLRVLQDGTFERVGGGEMIQADARILAATNVDLAEAVAAGKFREDLYYRLNVVSIELPPLRERIEDLPLLVEHFLTQLRERRFPSKTIARETLSRLARYEWPGNVRELEHVVEQMVVTTPGPEIEPRQPARRRSSRPARSRSASTSTSPGRSRHHRRADRADRAGLPPEASSNATGGGSTAAPSIAGCRGGASPRSSAATRSTRPSSSPTSPPPVSEDRWAIGLSRS